MDSARSLWLWLQQNVADWQNNTQLMRSVDLTNILEVFSRD
jgi:DNA mismatch repair protein MutL